MTAITAGEAGPGGAVSLAEATVSWERLLRDEPPDLEAMIDWQRQHHLVAEAPLCRVLRPGFVTAHELADDQWAAAHVRSAIVRAADRITEEPALRRRYLGTYWEEHAELFTLPCGHSRRCQWPRMDAFPTENGLRFLELNCNPGGPARVDALTRLFSSLPIFQRYAERYRIRTLPVIPAMLEAIRATYREWGGTVTPNLAALRPQSAPMTKLQQLSAALGQATGAAAGVMVDLVDPRELSFADGVLRHGEKPIHIVTGGVLSRLLKVERAALQPLCAAVRSHAVCLVEPFGIYGHKALFAALTDPGCTLDLSDAEWQAVRAHLPWTRVVRAERTTDPAGQRVELLDFAEKERERLVLKPATESGGAGVVFGWETSPAEWEAALSSALGTEAGSVLQERVVPLSSRWPLLEAGLPMRDFTADRSPFLVRGHLTGYYTRLSSGPLTNVSQGGSIAPTFAIEGLH